MYFTGHVIKKVLKKIIKKKAVNGKEQQNIAIVIPIKNHFAFNSYVFALGRGRGTTCKGESSTKL